MSRRSVDVPLGQDRTLRVSLVTDDAGAALVFASGFGGGASGRDFHRPAWADSPLRIPALAIPDLRRALAEIDE